MINCLIVDDEQHAIDILVHYVQQTPQLHLAGAYTNPLEALPRILEDRIDLVFLDIQMPELSGIDFIKTIQGKCKVILTTAYSEFALEGYELYVVDYLLKPIRLPRFLTAVRKLLEHTTVAESANDYVFVKTESKGKLQKIELGAIELVEGMKNYVVIHSGGKRTAVYATMKNLEEHLPEGRFIRVHKSFIVPVAGITGIEGNALRLKNVSGPVPIGERYKAAVMNLIQGKTIG